MENSITDNSAGGLAANRRLKTVAGWKIGERGKSRWAMQESNLRPLRCERSALAAAPIARIGKDHRSDPRGRYWIRTSDPVRVREVRYLCANRPGHSRFEREVGTRVELVYTALQAAA